MMEKMTKIESQVISFVTNTNFFNFSFNQSIKVYPVKPTNKFYSESNKNVWCIVKNICHIILAFKFGLKIVDFFPFVDLIISK